MRDHQELDGDQGQEENEAVTMSINRNGTSACSAFVSTAATGFGGRGGRTACGGIACAVAIYRELKAER
jgi:hypothetical protein